MMGKIYKQRFLPFVPLCLSASLPAFAPLRLLRFLWLISLPSLIPNS